MLGFATLSIQPNISSALLTTITLIVPLPVILVLATWAWSELKQEPDFANLGGFLFLASLSFIGYLILVLLLCYFQQDYQPIILICSLLPGI